MESLSDPTCLVTKLKDPLGNSKEYSVIDYFGSGSFGNVFKVESEEKSYAAKRLNIDKKYKKYKKKTVESLSKKMEASMEASKEAVD